MSCQIEFDMWRVASQVDGIIRSDRLAKHVAEMNEHVLKSEDWHEWRPVVTRAISIVAEQAMAEDTDAYVAFASECERRGVALDAHEVQELVREASIMTALRCMAEVDAILGDRADLLECIRDVLERRTPVADKSVPERAATIERELRRGTDLWWPESRTIASSYWKHPSPSVEVIKAISDEPLLEALPAAIEEARLFGEANVRIFDLANHLEGGHVGTASTDEALRSLAIDLSALDGPIVFGDLGTLDECEEAVAAHDLTHLSSVIEASGAQSPNDISGQMREDPGTARNPPLRLSWGGHEFERAPGGIEKRERGR